MTSNTTSTYKQRRENAKKIRTGTTSSSSNDMESSISNYKTRLKSAGINPTEATDTRNWFEKLTNLPEDQNALFDLFELMQRPQQALFTGIDEALTGGSFTEGLKSGIKGEETTSGGDLLRDLGVNDDYLFTNPITKDDTSLADLLGLGLDIFVDPVDVPVAGTGKTLLENAVGGLAKGTKNIAGKAITKGAEALDTKTISKLAKSAGLIEDGTKVTSDMLPTLTKQLADVGVDFTSKTDALKTLKKSISRTTDYASSIPDDLYNTLTRSNNALDAANAYGKKYASDLKNQVSEYAKLTEKNADEVSSNIQKLITSKYAPEKTIADSVLDIMKDGKSTIKGDAESLKALSKSIDDFKIANNITDNVLSTEIKGGKLTLKGNKKLLGNVVGTQDLMNKLSNIKFTKSMNLDEDLLKEIEDINKLYSSDNTFKSLVDNAESGYTKFNNAIKQATGENIDFSDMLREGYATNALTDEGKNILSELKQNNLNVSQRTLDARKIQYGEDILEGNKKVVSGKKYDAYAESANRQFNEDLAKAAKSKESQINYLESQRHEKSLKSVKENLADNKIAQINASKIFNDNIDKLNLKKESADALKKSYDRQFDSLSDIINDKVMKKAETINNSNLVESLSKKADSYAKKSNRVTSLQAELSKANLTNKDTKALTNKLEKALNSQNNAKSALKAQVAKIQGAASEKYIKNADKLANEMVDKASSLTKKSLNQQNKVNDALSKINQAKNSYSDIANQLKKQQADLQLQLTKLESMSKSEITKSENLITDKIASLQKDYDLLTSFEGQKLFSTNFFEGFEDYINKTTTQAKAMTNYNEALLHSGLNNENVIKFVKKGEDTSNLTGMVKLDTSKVDSYLDAMKNFMPEDSQLIKDFKNQVKTSKDVYVEKGVNELLSINSKINSKEANMLLDTFDNINNLFKKTSTLSPGFQFRNATGNGFNMWLSGMSAKNIGVAYKDAARLSKSDYMIDLITKSAEGTLTKAEKADYNVIKQFIDSGALGSSKDIRDLGNLIEKASSNNESKNVLKKLWDGAFNINAKANEKMDNLSRMALLSYATKDEKYVAKLGAKDAIDAMKQVLFDPQNLSPFEKQYMKKIIPFYTFTKQNLMFQMKNVINNTSRYNKLVKAYNKLYESIGEGNYRQYQKENFEIPIKTDSGTISLKTNLPISDLGEYMSNPLQRLVSSTSPLIKTPFEQVTGVDTFTGQDISDRSPLQALLDTTGLSNLTTDQLDKYNDLKEGNITSDNALAKLFPSIFRYIDPEKVSNQEQYEELQQYQNYIKQLKAQGIDIPTIKELTSSTNKSLNSVQKRRSAYQKRKSS